MAFQRCVKKRPMDFYVKVVMAENTVAEITWLGHPYHKCVTEDTD